MATGKFIAYYRVSTARQGRSGLGLDAQQKAVEDYLNGGSWQLIATYKECESGKRNDRPELAKALRHAKVTGATLIVAKLDRLARNVAFLANLMESGCEFVCADMPTLNKLTVHVLAAVAENEREAISKRTKEALAAAKARGRKLGGARPGSADLALYRGSAVAAIKQTADRYAADILPIIDDVRASGITSLAGIAAELNARGILTARSGQWYAATVRNVLRRTTA